MSKNLPGRLGDPEMTLLTDPRIDPRIADAIVNAGELTAVLGTLSADASYEEGLDYCRRFDDIVTMGRPILEASMPVFDDVESYTDVIRGVDDNDITLFIHKPRDAAESLPGVLHLHGGGMVTLMAVDPMYRRWRNELARKGVVVVGVEFRNGGGHLGNHPFPAGLNDCASALRWMHSHRQQLGVSNLVVSGESGGGNLSLATAIKAKREGYIDCIQGVYAMCPYISGAYADPPAHLLSLRENDGYSLSCDMMSGLSKVYDPQGENATNPLTWPYYASVEDLQGLPPHVISVNELDPLRDEGLAFFRKLLAAGNSATARQVPATNHAADMSYPDIAPEHFHETQRSIVHFAGSLK
jgi:acetyl esterase/lipase